MNRKPGARRQATLTLEIASTTELSSAQQRMSVLNVSRIRLQDIHCSPRGAAGTGKEQHGRTLSFPIYCHTSTDDQMTPSQQAPPATFLRLLNALRQGQNRLVLREWRQGACWWNLNTNEEDSIGENEVKRNVRGAVSSAQTTSAPCTKSHKARTTLSMARAEVAGYRLSRFAIVSTRAIVTNLSSGFSVEVISDVALSCSGGKCAQDSSKRKRNGVFIPEVLYFSHDDEGVPSPSVMDASIQSDKSYGDGGSILDCNQAPWALLSFFDNDEVKPRQQTLDVVANYDVLGTNGDLNNKLDYNQPLDSRTNPNTKESTQMKRIACRHFSTTMIKTRHEFGFEEPHPRHGRVPIDECLEYALMVLRDWIMPVQSQFFMLQTEGLALEDSHQCGSCKYNKDMRSNLLSLGWCSGGTVKPFQYHDMIAVYRSALNRASMAYGAPSPKNKHDRIKFYLKMLDKCVDALDCEWDENGGRPPTLPPVLCHMDLQPQNLAFCFLHESGESDFNGNDPKTRSSKHCSVAAVMDWEDACYADPRFELLLICRKVLANREQSEKLWLSYSNCVQQLSSLLSSYSSKQCHWDVGPLEPWLKLETVHSICTLLLQAVNLLGGGRNPWESTPELWGKIDRERKRLVQMGWSFCQYVKPVSDLNIDS